MSDDGLRETDNCRIGYPETPCGPHGLGLNTANKLAKAHPGNCFLLYIIFCCYTLILTHNRLYTAAGSLQTQGIHGKQVTGAYQNKLLVHIACTMFKNGLLGPLQALLIGELLRCSLNVILKASGYLINVTLNSHNQ